MELSDAQRKLARHICTFVDRTGYLGTRLKIKKDNAKKENEKDDDVDTDSENDHEVFRPSPLTEIASLYDELTTPEEVEDTLVHVVQKLDPAGVGARTMAECLQLQIAPDTPYRDVLQVLVRDHLDDIANNRIPIIHKATKFEIQTIQDAIETLRHHLDPKPGLKFAETGTQYVMPDVIVERTDDDQYAVRLTDEWVPRIRISKRRRSHQEQGHRRKVKEELRKKLQSADWLVKAVEQPQYVDEGDAGDHRASARVLDAGPEHIQPLKMQQIADQVKVHVTTVSRAVDDKWVQTPRGVFPSNGSSAAARRTTRRTKMSRTRS